MMVIIFLFLNYYSSSLLSKSEYIKCENDENCKNKLLISLVLENSQLLNSEKLSFNYNQFELKDDKTIYKIDKPINITFSKSEVDVLYKLSYISHFNSKVYEKVINSVWPLCTEGLWQDNKLFKDSTCKYKKDSKNKIIENSQGFCCKCPELTILTGIKNGINRSDCGFFSSSETAHCLEFSKNWFGAYEIISKQYDYFINIKIDIPLKNEMLSKNITISTNKRTVNDENSGILIKLIGDFLPLNSPPDIINKVILVPQPKDINITGNESITNNWLIVDRSMISIDGKECNKIGTSYDAFQSQRNKCENKKGTCLNNQIEDLIKEDENNLKNNKTTKYLLKFKGNFYETINKNNEISIKLKFKEIFTTQINFELIADDFKFFTNKGKGIIEFLKIEEFNSFNENGNLEIKIKNIGNHTSNFELNPDCDEKINKLQTKKLSIESNKSKVSNFIISSKAPKGYNHTCNFILNDSLGNLLDTKNITFNSLETIKNSPHYNNTNLFNYTDIEQNENLIEELEIKKCELLCPESYNLFCIIINGCLSNFHKAILIYGILLYILIILIKKFKKKCCCCFYKKIKKSKDENKLNKIENNMNSWYKNNFDPKNYEDLRIKLDDNFIRNDIIKEEEIIKKKKEIINNSDITEKNKTKNLNNFENKKEKKITHFDKKKISDINKKLNKFNDNLTNKDLNHIKYLIQNGKIKIDINNNIK